MGRILALIFCLMILTDCNKSIVADKKDQIKTAAEIFGNSNYTAIAYGGYRGKTRDQQPTIAQIKEDLKIMSAMGIRLIRTYNVHLPHASNVLAAIHELKIEDVNFEMYVMLGAWIDCKNAWMPGKEIHDEESQRNEVEIAEAVRLSQQYKDIVKVIAVGNEAMVKWAASYFVRPGIILKWVDHLQDLKDKGDLPSDLWITSSDNYASWGGGSNDYHVTDLELLIKAVDFISLHTYPMHETHYHPDFWIQRPDDTAKETVDIINAAMDRSLNYAQDQYQSVVAYMNSLGVNKPVHIGETGWATISDEFYGPDGSKACDEYKQGKFYQLMREWTDKKNITCFYFEAFDEKWKDEKKPNGSENHFGLINLQGQAKYAIWELVDDGVFNGLTRDGFKITKTFNGDEQGLINQVSVPPIVYDNNL